MSNGLWIVRYEMDDEGVFVTLPLPYDSAYDIYIHMRRIKDDDAIELRAIDSDNLIRPRNRPQPKWRTKVSVSRNAKRQVRIETEDQNFLASIFCYYGKTELIGDDRIVLHVYERYDFGEVVAFVKSYEG